MQKNANINVFSNIYRNHDVVIKIRLIKFRIIFPAHSSILGSASLSESKMVGNLIINRHDIIHKHIFTHEMAKVTTIIGQVSRRYAAFIKGASN